MLIEGEPYISQVPVEPGLTNKETVDARTGERIVGLNTDNSEIDEGKIYFDIIFYVRMRDGLEKEIPPKEERSEIILKMHKKNEKRQAKNSGKISMHRLAKQDI